ncbi:hypothetical protein JYU34_013155 [Plutella xylostella]|uniref:Uncharacterized protein n=1 Tax=Plutella xylostella TaxID=51655 RepID=A0ABQ7QDJ2_PLUXY|nr:hypothetical protein JYU34_013155 [Plutella xylostella]
MYPTADQYRSFRYYALQEKTRSFQRTPLRQPGDHGWGVAQRPSRSTYEAHSPVLVTHHSSHWRLEPPRAAHFTTTRPAAPMLRSAPAVPTRSDSLLKLRSSRHSEYPGTSMYPDTATSHHDVLRENYKGDRTMTRILNKIAKLDSELSAITRDNRQNQCCEDHYEFNRPKSPSILRNVIRQYSWTETY